MNPHCKHPPESITYHPDPSGNNDSEYICECGHEVTRQERHASTAATNQLAEVQQLAPHSPRLVSLHRESLAAGRAEGDALTAASAATVAAINNPTDENVSASLTADIDYRRARINTTRARAAFAAQLAKEIPE